MRNGWIETTIGEQVTLQRGIDITKANQRPGNVPVVSSGGVASFHDTAHAKGPGVVLGRKGVVGSVYYIDTDYWPHDTSLWVRDFRGNNPRFVYYFFRHLAPVLASMDVGSANPTLNRNHVHPIKVVWPSREDQETIAHILGTLDDKIELNRQMNQTLDEMARTLFRSWFIDFDPVRAKMEGRQPEGMDAETAALFPDRLVDSEIGPIPEGWEASTLESEFSVTMGQSPPGHTYNETGEGQPFYQGRTDFGLRFPAIRLYCTEPKRTARAGDTLLSVRAPVGDLNVAFQDCIIGRGVAALRHKGGSPTYTFHALSTLASMFLTYNKEGTVFGSINQRDLKALPIVAPSDRAIESFIEVVSPLDELLRSNYEESCALTELRDALLSNLIAGRLQIPVADRLVGAVV